MTAGQIADSDNCKVVPDYQTRNKVFTYIPPNVMVNGYNPSAFHSTQVTPYQGTIYIATGPARFLRVEINLIFRGSRDYSLPEIINRLQKLEFKKEEEENKVKKEKESDEDPKC